MPIDVALAGGVFWANPFIMSAVPFSALVAAFTCVTTTGFPDPHAHVIASAAEPTSFHIRILPGCPQTMSGRSCRTKNDTNAHHRARATFVAVDVEQLALAFLAGLSAPL